MTLLPADSPEDDYFNDLSRQPTKLTDDADTQAEPQDDITGSAQAPKPKRIACVLCR
jgi:hypothetical protein